MAKNQWLSELKKKDMEIRRIRAVQSVLDGKTQCIVAKDIGVSKAALSQWIMKYKRNGWEGLLISNNHSREGILKPEDVENLKEIMSHKPNYWGFDSDLWTANMAREVLAEKYNKSVSYTTILVTLKKTGIHIKNLNTVPSRGTWIKLESGKKRPFQK